MENAKEKIKHLATKILGEFSGSKNYWRRRYRTGGDSGAGSYGELAEFKAEIINNFITENNIENAIELGCGDGNQLEKVDYPKYIGLDVSKSAIRQCKERFSADETKSFFLYDPECFVDRQNVFSAELGLSLDVIFIR